MSAPLSVAAVAAQLAAMFPAFSDELAEDPPQSYHHLVQLLAPQLHGYLRAAPDTTIRRFCELVNSMAEEGGDKENAIATCLLEHASQLGVRKALAPYLRGAAKLELR